MRLSRPFLTPFCALLLLAGLAGCGPASSENASSPRTDPSASAASSAPASPASLASEKNKTSSVPASSIKKPTNPMDDLAVPAWIAKDLASPDVDTRLRALETWVLISPVGSIDPLILAFGNDDERVRTRAMELLDQDWARAADRAL